LTIERLSRRYDEVLLEKLIYVPRVDAALVEDPTALERWIAGLLPMLNSDLGISESCSLKWLSEGEAGTGESGLLVERKVHGISTDKLIPFSFFSTVEYRNIVSLGAKLSGLLSPDAYVRRGEKRHPISSFRQALEWLMEEAKRGQHVQRYKGLGEMNPEQLWETTMDADARRLLLVNIEDVVAADEVFTTLMGDQVEPRRDFIETHALSVENLDI